MSKDDNSSEIVEKSEDAKPSAPSKEQKSEVEKNDVSPDNVVVADADKSEDVCQEDKSELVPEAKEGEGEKLAESTDDELDGEDPLAEAAEAFDLEHGERLSQEPTGGSPLPWKSRIESAKEFFNTEILYRHDILMQEERAKMVGKYRLELKGFNGGIWSLDVASQDITVENCHQEADVVLSMQQSDFLRIINGELNPQLGILSQKVRVSGDVQKAVALQFLLAPSVE